MSKRTLLIYIRYLSLFMVILNIFSNNNEISFLPIILIMSMIINNQVRFFNFKNNSILSCISIAIEIIIVSFLQSSINSVGDIFYFIPSVLDVCFFKNSLLKYILLSIIALCSFVINLSASFGSATGSCVILIIISVLCIYIYNESLNKVNIQNLYDKLRISEDNLKKSNSDLEIYASSVQELAILKERNRISREIHDSVGHALSTTIIQLGALEKLLTNNKDLFELVKELRLFVNKSLQDVRRAVTDLKPIEYEIYQNLFKIEELTNNFTKLTNIDVKLTISKNTWDLSSVQYTSLYRIVQESLSNSSKHGKSSKINIFITFNTRDLVVTISDNGIGCKNIVKGNGINSICERINELNGTVEFDNSSNGFSIRASFPKHTGGDFIEKN
ncbi:sensor histidine kinase [Romboutsia weinsteinii]|uniref:histidine kinase n=1 Tax=Romboutsia weinsteinii TaxID=2020949 RepID=A0A371J7Z4_9FIRM|nr:sensor histidine kinase [Romboutsia weinsteinii]RDY28787.1 sensor histidine kinase [Romboutsia weinsteinii]